jgi:hypothetical protein
VTVDDHDFTVWYAGKHIPRDQSPELWSHVVTTPKANRLGTTVRYPVAMRNVQLVDRPGRRAAAAAGTSGQPRAAAASTALAGILFAPSRPARVLGASAAALYLGLDSCWSEPSVIAVVAFDSVRLPLALVLADRVPSVDGELGSVGSGAVSIGRLRLRPARWFDPRPRLALPYQPSAVAAAALLLAELPAEASGLPGVQADAIATGLVGGDAGPALDVIGRGPGLTPAGDDVLAGALAAIALRDRLDAAATAAVMTHAVSATTSLSSSLLRCAAAGQVVPQAATLLSALCGGAALRPALDDLLSVGATSGTALALGCVAGARAVLAADAEHPA